MLCRACNTELEPFMSFGEMPLANGFLDIKDLPNELFYELAPAVCPTCSLFQIMEQPLPDRMFHAEYPYYTANSSRMQTHFERFADSVKEFRPGGFVVEIGCNDGTMLKHFVNQKHLGIEPATNVANVAKGLGCSVVVDFFDGNLAKHIVLQYGRADAIIAANVICHVANLPDLLAGVRHLLKPDGLFIFEEPYLLEMMGRCSFDQIYDEHVFLFSITSVLEAFGRHGLYLVGAELQWAHGGSMRYYVSPRKASSSMALHPLFASEAKLALTSPGPYKDLKARIEEKRDLLQDKVNTIRRSGGRIAGYGATSKSTTVTVYCGFGPNEIEYIADTTPIKQHKLSPGAHIPIRPYSDFATNYPDVALLFAWNHADEIYAKEKNFKGQWLNYVPQVVLR